MSTRTGFGGASDQVRELVQRAQTGGSWYEFANGSVAFVEVDENKFWAGTVYEVTFSPTETGYGDVRAATWVMDIAEDEAISPGSSSPWNGWLGWQDGQLTLAWQNPEVGVQDATTVQLDFEIDDEPIDEQWARLARRLTDICFSS